MQDSNTRNNFNFASTLWYIGDVSNHSGLIKEQGRPKIKYSIAKKGEDIL